MASIKVCESKIEELNFLMMPRDGGRIVEISYACDENGVYRRCYDRSDGAMSYDFASYSKRAKESDLEFEPQNGRLPKHNQWQRVRIA